MTFIRGQKVRIKGGGGFYRENYGKTGTYIAEHPQFSNSSIVVVDGGINYCASFNGYFNINGYDYGLTSELEPVKEFVAMNYTPTFSAKSTFLEEPATNVVDDQLIYKLYSSMLVDLQNSLIGQTNQSTKKTLMRKLSELSATIRRTFSPDQKALWRTGRIDDAGKPTQQAIQEALQELALAYIKEHQADFIAAAKEELEIEEQEKE